MKTGFPLLRYFRLRLSKHVFDADRNGHPLGENLKTYKVIPASAGIYIINNNFLSAILSVKPLSKNIIFVIILNKLYKEEKNAFRIG